jgi:SpoVK/Ycf46/Vps4 family AAA+-type ATPase
MAQAPQVDEQQTDTIETSNYEVIRRRLMAQGDKMAQLAAGLNERRQALFGSTAMEVVGGETLRTENNCIPQDIINLGDHLLFGYNVQVRMKAKMAVSDVFSLHRFERDGTSFALRQLPADGPDNFLTEAKFNHDFDELYTYYKDAKLRQLRRVEGHLLGLFQFGTSLTDVRVLAWRVDVHDDVTYRDNSGEKDNVLKQSHDFKWVQTKREDHVLGKHPHISIRDKVFVETVGGDLTIKIEDNTEDGNGIYAEADLVDKNQGLGDADIAYAEVGALILLRIKPYRESTYRYFIFNTITKQVERVDAIGLSCLQLPEGHGVVFPGGYALETGEVKRFEVEVAGMRVEHVQRAPNGEDALYVFYRPSDGAYLLLAYNLIRKEVQTPLLCKGYSIFADGTLLIFRASPDDVKPTTVHPLQIWQTPFMSDEHAASAPVDGSFLAKVGNAELVRGISDALSIRKTILNAQPTVELYASIISAAERMIDAYYWLQHEEVGGLAGVIKEITQTAKLVIEEFRKVRELREQAGRALREAEDAQKLLLADLRYANWKEIGKYVDGLDGLRRQRGRLITLRELKYMDLARIEALEAEVIKQNDLLSEATARFLMGDSALVAYRDAIQAVLADVEAIATAKEGQRIKAEVDRIGEGLTLLTEIVGSLKIDDTRARTQILEGIAEVLGQQNRARALMEGRLRTLHEQEGQAEFAVQFQLFAQSVTSALGMAESPEKAEDLLARLTVQLEEMEARFGQHGTFLDRLTAKREEVLEVFEAKKQQLMDERQRHATSTLESAERMVAGAERRAKKMGSVEELNAYFAADATILKIRELANRLRELHDPVKADDIENKLKATRDQAVRSLRDKLEMFEEGGDNVIKLGRHRFSVHTQAAELTMVPRAGVMCFHLTGSDLFEPIRDPGFAATSDLWEQTLISESPQVYRAEYLAACILRDAERGVNGASIPALMKAALQDDTLMALVRSAVEQRYDEGYERGVHDADAVAILRALMGLYHTAGMMRYSPDARALACLFWANAPASQAAPSPAAAALLGATNLSGLRPGSGPVTPRAAAPSAEPSAGSTAHSAKLRAQWMRRAQSLGRLQQAFSQRGAVDALVTDLAHGLTAFVEEQLLDADAPRVMEAARYLIDELAAAAPRFTLGADAARMADAFWDHLDIAGVRAALEEDLRSLSGELKPATELVGSWLDAFIDSRPDQLGELRHLRGEAIAHLITRGQLEREISSARVHTTLSGVLGLHPRIKDQQLALRLDEFLSRLYAYLDHHVPRYRTYRKQQHTLLEQRRKALRLDELKPKVLSTFVRNQLIDEVYLPLIGANLAKQMGSVGESGRSDRMGLLLLMSPPGYGKTTLMEYVASRLGLTFMKVNGPSLGHTVTSVDPSEAPNATARQEVEKINLALRMGNNVMLYLDDIQHTNSELLQKFISLCDATRRMEGVWEGETQTYDLRGKRFCVVMAGNPYTETGERFQIPDMLANRADTYNLGDILDGAQDAFAMSYIENALTSNPVLAPLANRERGDVVKFARMARGESIPLSELAHGYSAVEGAEIVNVLQKLIRCQQVLLKVNLEYIRSASQEDAFRTEPPFKLQGSYRNMTKLAEKVVSAMNDAELESLIDDHYLGESQTLTTTAEQNLLKLAELRGRISPEQAARWAAIKQEFMRRNMMGGRDDDPVARVAGPLAGLVQQVEGMGRSLEGGSKVAQELSDLRMTLMQLAAANRQSAQHAAVKPAAPEEPKLADVIAQLMGQQNAMMERAFGQIAAAMERAAAAPPVVVQAAPQAAPARPMSIPAPVLGASTTRDSGENVYIDPRELDRAFGADPATNLEPGAPPNTTQPMPAIVAAKVAEDTKPAPLTPPQAPRKPQRAAQSTEAGKPAGEDK